MTVPAEEHGVAPEPGEPLRNDSFRNPRESSSNARRTLSLAVANLKVPAGISDSSLVKSSQGLHVLDNAPLVGNQQQLICKDAKGAACEKRPVAADTVRDCVIGAGGFAGLACLATGGETVGIGCVVSAVAAVRGGLICAHDVSQRSSCTCVTPCAAQCSRRSTASMRARRTTRRRARTPPRTIAYKRRRV